MKKSTLDPYDQLLAHLADSVGMHHRIARETGVAQATVSRIHLRRAIPSITNAQKLLNWFAENPKSKRSAIAAPYTRGRRKAAADAGAPASLCQ